MSLHLGVRILLPVKQGRNLKETGEIGNKSLMVALTHGFAEQRIYDMLHFV
ncbi:hypothetical protein J2Z83_002040 [Virgibacillus natechei]|uniref:Uncharacterized protein n=1 Tax=Virgibacillus natechei TaxID=1216297 RepID=A0ABS4IG68_9BACI|nr:hypothetical protein [Virgibacillus natechei]